LLWLRLAQVELQLEHRFLESLKRLLGVVLVANVDAAL